MNRTENPGTTRSFRVVEDVGRVWPPPKPYLLHLLSPFKFCACLTSVDLPRSFVITNGWTRRRATRKARDLWFEHVRYVTEDETCSILCTWTLTPSAHNSGGKQ